MSIIVTNSGKFVNLADPQPESICIEDIAHHLAHINRFTGATTTAYSVATHSIYVAGLVSDEYKLQALMHDATEAYLGDVSSPLKSILPEYKLLEAKMHAVIADKFGFSPTIPKEVHEADGMAYVKERTMLFSPAVPIEADPDYDRWEKVAIPSQLLLYASPWLIIEFFLEDFNFFSHLESK